MSFNSEDPKGPSKPIMIYDGDCGFCRSWIARWRSWTGNSVVYTPYQETASRFPQISTQQFENAVHLVEPDGTVSRGSEAVFRVLAYAPGKSWMLWIYKHLPGFSSLAELAYGFVARNRVLFSWLTYWLWGEDLEPPTFRFSSWFLSKGVSLCFLIAFVSAWAQIDGLMGAEGILPAQQYFGALSENLGWQRFWYVPSLLWFNSSNAALHVLCAAGAISSVLSLFGFLPALFHFLQWGLYLSIVVAGRNFFSYQWDSLLLEAGLLVTVLIPFAKRVTLRSMPSPSGLARFLFAFLLFRLMFFSGVVKLTSGDASWSSFTALFFHYETQPLPTWIGWYAHQLPQWFQKVTTALLLFIELVLAWAIFLPRRPRVIAAAGFIILQAAIFLTGNYGFFNILSIILCLVLIDDHVWKRLLPKRARHAMSPSSILLIESRIKSYVLYTIAVLSIWTGLAHIGHLAFGTQTLPRFFSGAIEATYSLRSFNGYGLFAIMTTTRDEIVVEGSNDGREWLAYDFNWKPGELSQKPKFVAPHMPRLDWQMWFASLGSFNGNPWFQRFLERLLRGSPEVLSLLAHNPFSDAPPKYVRATIHQYKLTTFEERKNTGNWWKREAGRLYAPALTLEAAP